MRFSVLHLSDLHFSNKHAAQHNLIRDAFWEDLNAQLQENGKPNAVVFSGDIVNNPDEEDVYLHAIDKFFDPLSEKTGVKSSNFIFCPGNHDVSWRAMNKQTLAIDGLQKAAHDTSAINSLYKTGSLSELSKSLSSGFFDFCNYLGNSWDNPFYKIYKVGDAHFVSINMAFSCSSDGSRNDRGRLLFPVSAVEEALEANGSAKHFGLVGHFSLDEMNEAHVRELRPIVQASATVHFFGHVHDARPLARYGAGSQMLDLQAGALYAAKDFFKGYSLLEFEDEKIRVKYRNYFDGRREFDEATNVGRSGLFYPNEESRAYWSNKKPDYTRDQVLGYLQRDVFKTLEREYNDILSKKPIMETFVFPTFGEPVLSSSDEAGDAKDELRGEEEIRKTDEHICCHFPDETGATSFLQFLSLQMCNSPSDFAVPRIPVLIDVRDVKSYPAAVLKSIKSAMPDSDHALFGWRARENDHPFWLLVDNYDPNNAEHCEWLRSAYRLLPKARFTICIKSPFAAQNSKTRPEISLPFGARTWLLYPFNRSEVRALVNRFELPDNLDRNLIVEEIISKFLAIGVPLSGPIIAMYLTVLRERKSYSPINAAAVIENFIEVTLEKADSPVVYLGEFDYKDQIKILSVVSVHFCRNNLASISHDGLYDLIKSYHDRIGINRNSSDVISHFVNKSIFERVGDEIYFRYRIFYSYFIALSMEDDSFKEYVLDVDRISNFVSELDIYFGMNRNDVKALSKIEEIYDSLKSEIIAQFGSFVSNEEKEIFALPRAKDADEFMEKICEQFTREVEGNGDYDRDSAVSNDVRGSSRFVQDFRKPEVIDPLLKWVKVLACYSVCIKNSSEFQKEEKERHIKNILGGWGMLSVLAYKVVALMLERGVVEVGSYQFNFGARRSNDPRALRHLVANIPRIVSQFTRMYLASDKLEAILKSSKTTAFPEFLRVAILVDMRSAGYMKIISEYRRDNSGKYSLLEAFMWKLRDSFLRFGLAKGDVDGFKQQVAELSADILGVKGDRRKNAVSQAGQRLEQQRIARRAKFSGKLS